MKRDDKQLNKILADIIDIQSAIAKLPPISSVEKAKLDQSIAIDQLYYSSKLEGSNLSEKMIDKAIYGKEESAS